MYYGVQKIVAVNSGNYIFAEVDVSRPIHLAADNNRGKSTLVNMLQFLYIDDFKKMQFGERSLDDTRRHYFGSDKSYLIFECCTPAGIQCMLVRGLGNLRGGKYERYVYDGPFQRNDYVDEERQVREFQKVRVLLADRHLVKVSTSELWRVLSASAASGDSSGIPRLNILPMRKREEYDAFRDVFARLLSLSAAKAKTLKQLIIDSYARDLAERKIDVAVDYREDFERVERSERELAFIQAVQAEIDEGRESRRTSMALRDKIAKVAPPALLEARCCYRYIEAEEQKRSKKVTELENERKELEKEKQAKTKAQAKAEVELEELDKKLADLNTAHDKWSQYTPQLITALQQQEQQKARECVELKHSLEQAAKFDLITMERRVREIERRIKSDKAAYKDWEKTAAAELLRSGISDAELESAFRVARPELLKLVVGETLTIKNRETLRNRIREIASRIKRDRYVDETMAADLKGIAGPDAAQWHDRTELQKQIAIDEEDLRQQQVRLRAAQDREQALKVLEILEQEWKDLRCELSDYEVYHKAWLRRAETKQQRRDAESELKAIGRELQALQVDLDTNLTGTNSTNKLLRQLATLRQELTANSQHCHERLRSLSVDDPIISPEDDEIGAAPKPLESHVKATIEVLRSLANDARTIDELERAALSLQEKIRERSLEYKAQACYFGDADAEWERLIDSRDSLSERESANQKNWGALFKTLGARINGILTAMRNVKLAVEGINRGLKSYQVSNLRAVEIVAEEVHETYSALETLSGSEGLFQDHDAVEDAKKRLHRMIETDQVIELQSLFELRIRTQLADGRWQEAKSLDEIGSTGTGMTTKAMIFIQLVRAIASNERYRLHFYIDGLGELDDRNLSATAEMAVSKGIIPITADPRLHFEPLAHPEVIVYSLGQDANQRFRIDNYRTYHARRTDVEVAQSDTAP
jgi:hypothetical protein